MSDAMKDGGLAFPGSRVESIATLDDGSPSYGTAHYPGMTLRDYFAGQALTGLLSGPETELKVRATGKKVSEAEAAYALADAMLAERSKAVQS